MEQKVSLQSTERVSGKQQQQKKSHLTKDPNLHTIAWIINSAKVCVGIYVLYFFTNHMICLIISK